MSTIRNNNVIRGAIGVYTNAGAPTAGTSKVQTLTIGGTPTAGATSGFKISFNGYTTALILWSATNNTLRDRIDAALEALSSIGTGNVTTAVGTMTAGVGTITLTSAGDLAKLNHDDFVVAQNALTGTDPTVAIEETTPGVDATGRGATKGALLVDTDTPALYQNTSATVVPTWAANS